MIISAASALEQLCSEGVVVQHNVVLLEGLDRLPRWKHVFLNGVYLRDVDQRRIVQIYPDPYHPTIVGSYYAFSGACECNGRIIRVDLPEVVPALDNETEMRATTLLQDYKNLKGKPLYLFGRTNFWKSKIAVEKLGEALQN